MAFRTITISDKAYARLKKLKEARESFTDVILRELPEKLDTAGEIYDWIMSSPPPKTDPKLVEAVISGRGRRSKRSFPAK